MSVAFECQIWGPLKRDPLKVCPRGKNINNQWNGTLNCSDPIKLHKSIVGDVKDLVSSISLYDEDLANSKNVDLDNQSNFRIIDFPNGRCYTLRWDITFDTFSVHIFFLGQTSVSIQYSCT